MKSDQFDDPKDPYEGLYDRTAYQDLQKRLDIQSKHVRDAYYNANMYPPGTQWNKVPPEVQRQRDIWKKKHEAFERRLDAALWQRDALIKQRSPFKKSPKELFPGHVAPTPHYYNIDFNSPIYSDDECPWAEKQFVPFEYGHDYEWNFDDPGTARERGESEKVNGIAIYNYEMFHHQHIIDTINKLIDGK